MENQYKTLEESIYPIRAFTDKLPTLKLIFTPSYYAMVAEQLFSMKATSKMGPINSMFVFLFWDMQEGYKLTKILELFVNLVFSHTTTKSSHKKHLIGQIASLNSWDTLFELSVLGNLLNQVPSDSVELYPLTVGKFNVEARIFLADRWVYLEATTIHDTEDEAKAIEAMINSGQHVSSGSYVDFNKDKRRFIGKLKYKSSQFIPNYPNVLVLSESGSKPLFIHEPFGVPDPAIRVDKVGLVVEYRRGIYVTNSKNNCDPNCGLTDIERDKIVRLLSGDRFIALPY
jgi:hypothetical protein